MNLERRSLLKLGFASALMQAAAPFSVMAETLKADKSYTDKLIDKYLKVSRLIKRRTVANEACDNQRVSANGRPVKASYDVKVGDVLELKFGEKTVKVEVVSVADIVGKADAAAMYKEIR